ncbi:MAG TPA: NAD(P)/FAD-dependent oxidoreductase [Chitinophagales bacterium]|jgi:cation diffusion facilitator CzcD-associated flavoprotein CzcO|nr:NAD(P)/FAD-dependent oxidoreductase [Chitinophagales bacterium]
MKKNHVDVIIMGAGLSGIGAACHLQRNCPDKTYIVLEARNSMGGTWDLFRYPGIRSDSDMYTLGYNFKPWTNPKVIADGPSILSYIKETAQEYKVESKIKYHTKVTAMRWSSIDTLWSIHCLNTKTNETVVYTCNYLESCLGYYKYEKGYTPEFKGIDKYKGTIIHPQLWPEDLDYTNKEIIVIGSGATAVTLVPALTGKAKHVTMLQRSPTYVVSVPNQSLFPKKMNELLPAQLMYSINRTAHVGISMLQYSLSRAQPEMMKKFFIKSPTKELSKDYDVATHFTPKYNPWDERLCVVPEGDLFKAINKGKASVVTALIDTFIKEGILLETGEELKADIIITATGLELQMIGGIKMYIDDIEPDSNDAIVYKGMMIKDVPNFVFVVGYTNASWTLKADLASAYFCRLINETEKMNKKMFVPKSDKPIETEPIMDFKSGYVQRAIRSGNLPKQGTKAPWKLKQNYIYDALTLNYGKIKDGYLKFF